MLLIACTRQGLRIYHNWAGKRVLQFLKTAMECSPSDVVLLPSEALKLSRMLQAHLAHSKSSAMLKTWPWNLMHLICFATMDGQEAVTILDKIMQDAIGKKIFS